MVRSWWRSLLRKAVVAPRRRPRSHVFRLGVDLLEDRTVPSFFTSPTFAVGTGPVAQAVGDFNGDGKADLVVVNKFSNTVSVLLGNGDGTFQARRQLPHRRHADRASPWATSTATASSTSPWPTLAPTASAFCWATATAPSNPGPTSPSLSRRLALTVGDFNGDGKADLAIGGAAATTADMTVMLGNGNGTFQAPVTTVTATAGPPAFTTFIGGAVSIQSTDFNGDGHADLVVVNNLDTETVIIGRFGTTTHHINPGTASVLLGNGDGTFQAPQNLALGLTPESAAVGDFNNDGRPDFAVSNLFSNSVSVFTNTGGGNFSSSTISLPNNTQSGSIPALWRPGTSTATASRTLP